MVTSFYVISLFILLVFLVMTGIDEAVRFVQRKKKNYTKPLSPVMVPNEQG